MKNDILEEYFNDQTGYGFLKIHNKYGTFQASTQAAPEDMEIANMWNAMAFCEMKCLIQTYKVKARILRERAYGIHTAYKNLELAHNDNELMPLLYRQYKIALWDYFKMKDKIEKLENNYKNYTDIFLNTRRKFLKQIDEYKKRQSELDS